MKAQRIMLCMSFGFSEFEISYLQNPSCEQSYLFPTKYMLNVINSLPTTCYVFLDVLSPLTWLWSFQPLKQILETILHMNPTGLAEWALEVYGSHIFSCSV